MDKEKIVQYEKCCGCAACFNICPRDAIILEQNIKGFQYPMVIDEKCNSCGLCKKVCIYND